LELKKGGPWNWFGVLDYFFQLGPGNFLPKERISKFIKPFGLEGFKEGKDFTWDYSFKELLIGGGIRWGFQLWGNLSGFPKKESWVNLTNGQGKFSKHSLIILGRG